MLNPPDELLLELLEEDVLDEEELEELDVELDEEELEEEELDDELELLAPLAAREHSFTPPETLPPKVASLQTKLPDSTLKMNWLARPKATLVCGSVVQVLPSLQMVTNPPGRFAALAAQASNMPSNRAVILFMSVSSRTGAPIMGAMPPVLVTLSFYFLAVNVHCTSFIP